MSARSEDADPVITAMTKICKELNRLKPEEQELVVQFVTKKYTQTKATNEAS